MQKFHKQIKDQIQHEFTVYQKTIVPNKWYAGNRAIARGRAEKALANIGDTVSYNITTPLGKEIDGRTLV